MPDLSRKRVRERLVIRREPHWQRLAGGAYLGFRRGPDTWIARYRDRDKDRHLSALNVGKDDFDGAKRAAEDWFAQMGAPAVRSVKRATVKDALETYLAELRRHGRTDAAKSALGLFKTAIYKDAIADQALESASREDFEEWRERLTEGRKPRSVNRYVRQVMAALNVARELGHVGNAAAWSLAALSDDVEESGESAIFLDPEQRAALIAAADPNTAAFLRGLELTGARPKELAAATVRDFNGETVKFSHRKGKASKVRVRYTVLGRDGVEFFTKQAADRLSSAPLFTEDGGRTWTRKVWARQLRAAAKEVNKEARVAAQIPAGVGAYSFRHARISELLQVYGVDPLTTAQQTGTSLAQIEKAYHRFIPAALQQKLAVLKTNA